MKDYFDLHLDYILAVAVEGLDAKRNMTTTILLL